LEKAELFLTATGAATARELFANGGYDNFVFANDGSLTSETLYSSAHAHAILAADTSSGLSLSASKLTVSETTAGLSVSSGADVSWISPLNSSSTESVAAQAGATNETFAFGTGFGSDSITGFIAGSGKTHDILELSYKDLGITKQTSKTWIADLQTVGGNVTITEHIGGGSITLVGVSASSLVAADFKFTA